MKTIGLIGGMSWESTQLYYQHLNRGVAARLGGLASAQVVMVSVNFAQIAALQRAGEWDTLATLLSTAAKQLETSGAHCVLICTNTMHLVAPQVQSAITVPLLHIATPTCAAIRASGLTRVGLLGTRFTMEQTFLRDAYAAQGIECITPHETARTQVHNIIFDELCQGKVMRESRKRLQSVCADLLQRGAQCIVLACTELTLLLQPGDIDAPLFDTTALHAQAAVDFAVGELEQTRAAA